MPPRLVAAATCVALLACGEGTPLAPDGAGGTTEDARPPATADAPAPTSDGASAAPPPPMRDVDILFVIDNSPSMKEAQDNLARSFPAFARELERLPGGLPNLYIGFVSSDLGAGPTPIGSCTRPGGDRGILQAKTGCGLAPGARFVQIRDGGNVTNFQGTLPQTFACLASLGVLGCGFEHQLQAARVALYENATPENQGFLRREALLVVVILTDEDDCSAEPISDLFMMDFPRLSASLRCNVFGHICEGRMPPQEVFSAPLAECKPAERAGKLIPVADLVRDIKALKPRTDLLMVAGIFGWPQQEAGAAYRFTANARGELEVAAACSSTNGLAAPGVRLKAFVDAFGPNGSWHSICQDDFGPMLGQIGQAIARRLGAGR